MTTITIKRNKNIHEAFYIVYPAFYNFKTDEITLTKKILNNKYSQHVFDIINHEYLHSILFKEEGMLTSKKLDNIHDIMLDFYVNN